MNSALLKSHIVAQATTQSVVADKIGMSTSRFNAKINEWGGAEFTLGEMKAIQKCLHLNNDAMVKIFLS